ncbi:MAG: hypothetical protein RR754_03545 [Oscillospiraceae bacterium]
MQNAITLQTPTGGAEPPPLWSAVVLQKKPTGAAEPPLLRSGDGIRYHCAARNIIL